MMKRQTTERSLSAVAALLLFAVFAVGVLGVLLCGAQGYRRLTQRDERAYATRTGAQYLLTKLRQTEASAAVSLAAFGGGDALALTQTVDGEAFVTRVYCHDGWLMELFTPLGGEFAPEDGERVLPAKALALQRDGSLLHLTLTDQNGKTVSLRYALSREEAAP